MRTLSAGGVFRYKKRDGSFGQCYAPWSHFDPSPEYADGKAKVPGEAEAAALCNGMPWSRGDDQQFNCRPWMPTEPVKRAREPIGFEHQLDHLLDYHPGDKVTYGWNNDPGTIVRVANY